MMHIVAGFESYSSLQIFLVLRVDVGITNASNYQDRPVSWTSSHPCPKSPNPPPPFAAEINDYLPEMLNVDCCTFSVFLFPHLPPRPRRQRHGRPLILSRAAAQSTRGQTHPGTVGTAVYGCLVHGQAPGGRRGLARGEEVARPPSRILGAP